MTLETKTGRDVLAEADRMFGKIPDRWKGVPGDVKDRLYTIANAGKNEDVQPLISLTMRELEMGGERIGKPSYTAARGKVDIELMAAIGAHSTQNPDKFGPFNDIDYKKAA